MSWLKSILPSILTADENKDSSIPEGLWTQCRGCEATVYRAEFERNFGVCPKCDYHDRLSAKQRLDILFDAKCQREEIGVDVVSHDPLKFKDTKKYRDRLSSAKKKTGENEAIRVESGEINNISVVIAAFEFGFIGGSMGIAVGNKFVKGVEQAIAKRCPFICISCSGGARMQESLGSLMQMSRTAAVLTKLAEENLPYVSVLVDPCMGGVSASLAMLGDIIIAEPRALVGFAGPRVIEQTVREVLPCGFQRSEFLIKHGAIDQIIHRHQLKKELSDQLRILLNQSQEG